MSLHTQPSKTSAVFTGGASRSWRRVPLLAICFCMGALYASGQTVATPASTPTHVDKNIDAVNQARILQQYGKLPLSFERNDGQTDARVKFLSRGAGYTLFLTNSEAVLALHKIGPASKLESKESVTSTVFVTPAGASRSSAVLRMKLIGANRNALITATDELPGKSNYFTSNDPKKWQANIGNFARVRYQNVYPGVELVYYGTQGQLEYDFIVAPGADYRAVSLSFAGASTVRIDKQTGDLLLKVGKNELRFHKPNVYQMATATTDRMPVASQYRLEGGHRVAFEVGSYDHSKPLVIDPALNYSTYLGGSNVDAGYGIAVDGSYNAYVTGETASTNFPTTTGAFQTTCATCNGTTFDAFVTKLNPAGSALIYSTYLGGSNTDAARGIAVDGSGDAYVTGYTYSSDFPTTPGAFQTTCGSCSGGLFDAFVTKLNATGSALIYSTYLGGSGLDEGFSIALDASGDAYVTGYTLSANFPIAHAIDSTYDTNGDAFVTELNPTGSGLVYSTYLGGSNAQASECGTPSCTVGYGIAVDSAGKAYIAGQTSSADFPTTTGAYQTACFNQEQCSPGVFVTVLGSLGQTFVYSSYLSSGGEGAAQAIALDTSDDLYITGWTNSSVFPTTTYAFQGSAYSGTHAFVSEFNPSKSGVASLVYSTFLADENEAEVDNTEAFGIAVDTAGNAYLTGYTGATGFPTTPGAFKTSCVSCPSNVVPFITILNSAGSGLIYSTYLTDSDSNDTGMGYGITLDCAGSTYLTGEFISGSFPTTPGAFQTTPPAPCNGCNPGDAFVVKLVPGDQVWPLALNFGSLPLATPSTAQTATLSNSGQTSLPISSITITGADPGDFAQTNNCGTSLAAGASCTITVTFTPTGEGSRTAAVTITDTAANSPQTVLLSGTGIGPTVTLMPSSLTFSPQPVGTVSSPQTVTLTTTGTLTINSITTSGPFAQTNNCGSITSGCSISVTYAPKSTGTQTGTLTVSDNGANTPQTVSLLGSTGTEPLVTLSTGSLTFADQLIDTTSAAQTVKLTNDGPESLNIQSVAASGDFAVSSNTCGTTLSSGSSCSIGVTFHPTAIGTRTGLLTVKDNGSNSPQQVNLSGAGTYVSLSPATLNFGTQQVGTTSSAKSVSVTNHGTTTLSITAIHVTGEFAQNPELNTCGKTLAANASCTIKVFFKPTGTGTSTGSLSVSDNGGGSPQTVSLTGTGS
jgi:hypothetical protein